MKRSFGMLALGFVLSFGFAGAASANVPTYIPVGPVVGSYGGSVTITATLYADGHIPLAGRTLDFYLNGGSEPVASAVTNASGVAVASGVYLTDTGLTDGTKIGAGEYPTGLVTVFNGDEDYENYIAIDAFTVNKANPVLSVTNSPVTYNKQAQAATVSASVAGSVSSVVTGGAASQTNAGTYAVTANFTPTDTANYNSLTAASAGNFTISPRTVTVTPYTVAKEYNTADPTLTYAVTSGSVMTGDTFSGALTRASGTALGDYLISQGTLSLGTNYTLSVAGSRYLRILDTTEPTITLNGDSTIYLDLGEAYVEEGATVTDNHDTGLTADIFGSVDEWTEGTYYIWYGAIDSSENAGFLPRTVVVGAGGGGFGGGLGLEF